MKTKRNKTAARVMRGQTHRQQWAIVYQDGHHGRWRERACGSAMDMILGFVGFVGSNMLPVRLLAPGGLIAGEHNVKPRTKLRKTDQLRSNIERPAEPTKMLAKSYPFLTIRNPRSRR